MQRIWEVERAEGSDVLRLSTLEQTRRSLADRRRAPRTGARRRLTPAQQALAAQAFNHLVTPSGTKIAHGTRDLARWVGAPQAELELVLGALARARILRPVRTADSQPAYEIFHDVLADAVLAWRAEFEARAKARARARGDTPAAAAAADHLRDRRDRARGDGRRHRVRALAARPGAAERRCRPDGPRSGNGREQAGARQDGDRHADARAREKVEKHELLLVRKANTSARVAKHARVAAIAATKKAQAATQTANTEAAKATDAATQADTANQAAQTSAQEPPCRPRRPRAPARSPGRPRSMPSARPRSPSGPNGPPRRRGTRRWRPSRWSSPPRRPTSRRPPSRQRPRPAPARGRRSGDDPALPLVESTLRAALLATRGPRPPGRRHADAQRQLQPGRHADPDRRQRRCADLPCRLGRARRKLATHGLSTAPPSRATATRS